MQKLGDFLQVQFDKILLVVLVFFLSLYALHTAHHLTDVKLAEWATKTSDLITGALLTLITGGRLMQRRVDTEGGGTDRSGQPEPKSTTTTTVSTNPQAADGSERRATDIEPEKKA